MLPFETMRVVGLRDGDLSRPSPTVLEMLGLAAVELCKHGKRARVAICHEIYWRQAVREAVALTPGESAYAHTAPLIVHTAAGSLEIVSDDGSLKVPVGFALLGNWPRPREGAST